MAYIILALFIAVPLMEIAVFIEVGELLGLWRTLVLVVLTAVAGTYLLRQQGLATLRRAQDTMSRNEMPIRELFHGACLLVAGLLLLTPGFVTDGVGALLLLPPVRELLRGFLARRIAASAIHVEGFPGQGFRGDGFPRPGAGPGRSDSARDDVIEGEYEEVVEPREDIEPPTDSKWGDRNRDG